MRWFFRAAAAAMAAAAVYHLAALLSPPFNAYAYAPGYPAWRHILFIAINLTGAALLLARPRWLPFAFAPLAIWTAYSHGWLVVRSGGTPGIIDLASIAGTITILAGLTYSVRRH